MTLTIRDNQVLELTKVPLFAARGRLMRLVSGRGRRRSGLAKQRARARTLACTSIPPSHTQEYPQKAIKRQESDEPRCCSVTIMRKSRRRWKEKHNVPRLSHMERTPTAKPIAQGMRGWKRQIQRLLFRSLPMPHRYPPKEQPLVCLS